MQMGVGHSIAQTPVAFCSRCKLPSGK